MDNFGIVVQICSLPTAMESRSGLLPLLLAVIDFYNAADMQIALQLNRLILGGGAGSRKPVGCPENWGWSSRS